VENGARGIVAAATGNGTLHKALEAALARAVAAGVVVRVASRCPQGRMLDVHDAPWQGADGLSPVKARISLMLELMRSP
jgi:L-asparaginase